MRRQWLEIEERSRRIRDRGMRADWSRETGQPVNWRIVSCFDPLARPSLEATADLAGNLLEPGGGRERWLNELKARNLGTKNLPFGQILDENDNVIGHIFLGSIERVVEYSAVLCMQLAAEAPSLKKPSFEQSKEAIDPKVGQRIRELRMNEGHSQDTLAAISNISKSRISKYECARSRPSGETLKSLASALDSTVEYLLHGTDSSSG